MKLRCAGKRVYGWVYPDGTLEVICREKMCARPGHETRHLFNPSTGFAVDLHVPIDTEQRGRASYGPSSPQAPREMRGRRE
jgi:hypothetical protein